MVNVHHSQTGQLADAVALPAGEDAARGDVGQGLLLQHPARLKVSPCGGIPYFEGECGKPWVVGDEFVYFFQVYRAQRFQGGVLHSPSGGLVLDGGDGRHEQRHFESLFHSLFLFLGLIE